MTLIFLLFILFVPAFAQGDSTISLNSNRTAVLRLTGDSAFATAAYSSAGGETVMVTADSGGVLDVVLELIGPNGDTLAYADAADNGAPSIVRVALESAGDYTVRVNTFNGEGAGDVTVTVNNETTFVLTPDEPSLLIPLGANTIETVTLLGFDGGIPLSITVRDPRGLLDPRVALTGADGATLAANDDHATTDVSLNRFDARLIAQIPADAALRITDFLGRAGWLEVSINP